MGDKVSGIFQYLAMFVAGFAVAATISWRMTLVVLTVVPLLAIAGGVMAKFIADMATAGQVRARSPLLSAAGVGGCAL